jgi:hypothetical protein
MNWWRRLLKRGEMERHLDAELRFHFDGLGADNLRAGMSEPEARRNARLEFGGVEQVKEECRDARATRWIEESFRDIAFAGRSLRKSPIFAATAIVILALSIGGNTAMFTVIRTVLLKPLEYANPDGLVRVSIDDPAQDLQDVGFSWFQYEAIKNAKSFSGLGTYFIDNDPREIIGIAADIRQRLDANVWPEVDLPLAQAPLQTAALAVRVESEPKGLVNAIRKQVMSLDRDQTVSGVRTKGA